MKTLARICTILLLARNVEAADEIQYKKINLRGTPIRLSLPVDGLLPKKLVLWAKTNGNMTSQLTIYSSKERGIPLKAKAALIKEDEEKTLENKKLHYPIELNELRDVYAAHSECLDITVEEDSEEEKISPEDFPPIYSPLCDVLTQEDLQEMAMTLSQTFGGDWSPANACNYFVSAIDNPNGPDEDYLCDKFDHGDLLKLGVFCPDGGFGFARAPRRFLAVKGELESKTFRGLFRKDACLSKAKSNYLLMLELDLSKVDRSVPRTLNFSFRVEEKKIPEGLPAALKPESEGRYAPKPLFLMSWVGDTCGNKITVTSWKKGKPVQTISEKVYGLLSYKGLVIALSLANGALTGGKGTAELYTSDEAYGVCFDLARYRQNKNGYPQ